MSIAMARTAPPTPVAAPASAASSRPATSHALTTPVADAATASAIASPTGARTRRASACRKALVEPAGCER